MATGLGDNPLSSPHNSPNDIVNHDLFSSDYWRDLYSIGSFVIPLRQWEIENHGKLDRHDPPETDIDIDYYELACDEKIPIQRLPGMRTSKRVHTVKRIQHPMNTGMWDSNRQYLQDGSINFFGW